MANRSKRYSPEVDHSSSSALSNSNRRKLNLLIRVAVDDSHQNEARKLRSNVHQLSVQNELLKHEVDGLRQALQHKQKHKGKGRALDLQQHEEYHGVAILWSPRKICEARAREAVRERHEVEEKLQKARAKKECEQRKVASNDHGRHSLCKADG